MSTRLPPTSVRGAIRGWIEQHAHKLGANVLEIGSRQHDAGAWWVVNRDLAVGDWTGCDMQPGPNVDAVIDVHDMPPNWRAKFSGVLCSEVLEHVARPWVALPQIRGVVQRGGCAIFTTMTTFPVHGFPDDFYRYTESGLRTLLRDAGFESIEVASAGSVAFALNDHGERGMTHVVSPMHVFAVARC